MKVAMEVGDACGGDMVSLFLRWYVGGKEEGQMSV